ncbi:MAG TPA: PA4780 family RIO1-like protein kinase, partial [Labilithrix sp.]|nr:PA4780 family RIO1-like protein kinase [Labilithrix sp.]
MRVPESLVALFDYGVLDDVVRPLMSGKEAQVYLVVSGGRYAVAKIYKDAQNRSFKHRAEYTEGRKVRNTRDQRAIANRSKHGREKDEAAWRSTEVDMIHRLHAAGVRVPVPYHFIEGVLLMELVTDAEGNPAPRLGDLPFDADSARAMYDHLIRAAVQMLCAGVVHGDLSEFNVLVGADGPVVIDFPQSIDSAHNMNARKLLIRDVDNLHRFLARHVPSARRAPYAEEMWSLHERNMLLPDTRLRGDFRVEERRANTASVLELIGDANRDERKRREALGLRGGPAESDHRSPGGPSRDAQSRRAPSGPPQQSRAGAPKKDAPVYQGLRDEGLKFFRHLRDPQPGAPRNGQQGQRSQGQRPQGQHSQGQHAQGQRPQGQHSQGQPSHGQRPQGQHAQGQRPQGQHAQGQRPQGDRPQGQRPQGDRPQGD